uniref:TBCC domain containing 1 n=1 Tax=Cynoglossus semilaevis TaxID=244447 RepID=A0A3P8V0W5_CYNSE
MEEDSVSIWPRMEPFLLGALQVAPSSKLGLHYLRKMATYVRTREGSFPMLGWPMWRHIACGKLQLPDDLAWLYFETFDLLQGHTAEERLEWAECLSQCSSKTELDQQRSKMSVDTLQFLLFLYIQQLNRVSLRTSLIGEEWPSHRARSPSPSDRESKTSSQNKNWDDQAHLSFVLNHLAEILELLVEPGHLPKSGQSLRDCQVSVTIIPSVYKFCPEKKTYVGHTNRENCVLAYSYIIVSQQIMSVSLDKCRDSLVILGPVETSVHIHSCQNVRIVCVARRIIIGASSRCTIHSLTPTRPLLLPGNSDIVLGPFHTFYPSLEDHMASVGLAVVPNLWDQPLLLGTEDFACFRLLLPAEFNSLVIPFQMEGDTCEVPGGLPAPYQATLEEKQKKIQSWQKTVMEARLNKDQKQQFEELVTLKFHEWLLKSGNRKEIDSLIPPQLTSVPAKCIN